MKKKYLLVNPPRYEVVPEYFNLDFSARVTSGYYLPAALLRMGSYFRSIGDEVSLINCFPTKPGVTTPFYKIGKRRCGNFKDKEIFSPLYHFGISYEDFTKRLILQERPDAIYVTSYFTYQWESIHQIIRICKEVFPTSKVTLGGIYPTLSPEHAKTSLADEVHRGEFPVSNNCRLDLNLLEDVPNYIVLKTSRGCPGKCSYCSVSLLEGASMRYRPPEDVVAEIEEKAKSFNIREIVFWESNILLNPKEHLELLLDLIIKKGLKLSLRFPEGFNPELLTYELLVKMKSAGVVHLALSLETSSKSIAMERFRSNHKLVSFREKAKIIKALNIDCVGFAMAGMPGQDIRSIRTTVEDILDSGIAPLIMPFTPIPGTKEYEDCFESIAQKGLEDLHPYLWPCVDDSILYDNLCKLHSKCLRLIGGGKSGVTMG